MTHWRLRWCQSSVHPWHPLLPFMGTVFKLTKRQVLHLLRWFTHTHTNFAHHTFKDTSFTNITFAGNSVTHTSPRHAFLAHTDPLPSPFFFRPFPSRFYLSFATCWNKLTCGFSRSFFSCMLAPSSFPTCFQCWPLIAGLMLRCYMTIFAGTNVHFQLAGASMWAPSTYIIP